MQFRSLQVLFNAYAIALGLGLIAAILGAGWLVSALIFWLGGAAIVAATPTLERMPLGQRSIRITRGTLQRLLRR